MDREQFASSKHWSPDTPDFRDLQLESEEARPLRKYLSNFAVPDQHVDLRDWMPPPPESLVGFGATAHACCTLIEYYRRYCDGDTESLSRTFLHEFAVLLEHRAPLVDVSFRVVLKGIRRTGVPPQSFVQHLESRGIVPIDSPLCYQFAAALSELHYFRVRLGSHERGIEIIKTLLRGRIPCAFGMGIPSSMTQDVNLDLRLAYDRVGGTTAGVTCGYDDRHRITSKGAFRFSGYFPKTWGTEGYGWMAYEFVRQRIGLPPIYVPE